MKESADSLLEQLGAISDGEHRAVGWRLSVIVGKRSVTVVDLMNLVGLVGIIDIASMRAGKGDMLSVLLDEGAVVLLSSTAKNLEHNSEEDNANARASEHALGLDMPGGRQEACVNGIPIPQHLLF